MPPRRTAHHGCHQPDNPLDRKRHKVLRNDFVEILNTNVNSALLNQVLHHTHQGADCQLDALYGGSEAIADYLLEEKDFGLVDYILVPFDDATPDRIGRDSMPHLYAVASAVGHLSALFHALDLGYRGLEPYKSAAFSTLSERWSTITRWLRLLLFQFFKTKDAPQTTGNCIEFLRMTLVTFRDDGHAEDIFSLPCTIDLVYLLTCRAEVHPGESFALHSVVSILGILSTCLDSAVGPGISASFTLRLSTVNESTRRAVISALVGRAEQFSDFRILRHQLRRRDQCLDVPRGLQLLSNTTNHFLEANPSLWNVFMDQGFISKYASALTQTINTAVSSSVMDPEFWSLMATAVVRFITQVLMTQSPNRRCSLATATEAGLISGALTCLLQLDSQAYPGPAVSLADRVKELVQCYSPSSRVIKALAKTYPRETMDHIKDSRPDLRELYIWVDGAYHRGLTVFQVFGASINPHMCDNYQPNVNKKIGGGFTNMSVPGSCARITKTTRIWESLSTRRDQLTYIEFALNTAKNLPKNWKDYDSDSPRGEGIQNERDLSSNDSDREIEDPILILDFISYHSIAQTNLTLSEYRARILDKIIEINPDTRRFEAMVKEALGASHGRSTNTSTEPTVESGGKKEGEAGDRQDGEDDAGGKIPSDSKKRLVAGIFFHDMTHATVVLALVKSELCGGSDDSGGEGGAASRKYRYYRIVNSLFCLCTPDTVKQRLWQGKEEFTPVMVPRATEHFSSQVKQNFYQALSDIRR
ncbi:hypothetical protein EST38_g4371 [Candolleomyces aberdarensis]|uniref:Uncharacterized protein n=1 Tax=Candolleomyces aberdarensis TaxID=2316362 RepID=A0A4Q2DPU1_9AGAR|nr:hypothetical protein EST38_g4371 [Candolleomyces aberdarensis]